MKGQVYLVQNFPPDDPTKQGPIQKQVVVLQDHSIFPRKRRTTLVLTTTNLDAQDRPWNVFVAAGTFAPWKVDCLIQCADIWSWLVSDLKDTNISSYIGLLSVEVMQRVDLALAVSLSLGSGSTPYAGTSKAPIPRRVSGPV